MIDKKQTVLTKELRSKMKSSKGSQLFNVPNNDEGRLFIKLAKKYKHNEWKPLRIRGRGNRTVPCRPYVNWKGDTITERKCHQELPLQHAEWLAVYSQELNGIRYIRDSYDRLSKERLHLCKTLGIWEYSSFNDISNHVSSLITVCEDHVDSLAKQQIEINELKADKSFDSSVQKANAELKATNASLRHKVDTLTANNSSLLNQLENSRVVNKQLRAVEYQSTSTDDNGSSWKVIAHKLADTLFNLTNKSKS